MNWNEVCIFVSPKGLEPLGGHLYNLGVTGLIIEDDADFQKLVDRKSFDWDYIIDDDLAQKKQEQKPCIKFYIDQSKDGNYLLETVKDSLKDFKNSDISSEYGDVYLTTSVFREEDWANNWKQYFKPIELGENITIKPEWQEYENTDNRVIIEIDPGSAFGTGTHETTKMCVEALEKYMATAAHDSLLDVGTGSGILSIAAAKLGAKRIDAIDIDHNAVRIAKENIEKNGLSEMIDVRKGDLVNDISGTYDFVVANILADAIISLTSSIKGFMRDNSLFISSGIIDLRDEDVTNSFHENGFTIIEKIHEGDWLCFVCKK